MDPDETLRLMLEERSAGNWIETAEHAGNLLEWLAKGGLMPQVRPDQLRQLLGSVLEDMFQKLHLETCEKDGR